jgi:hypothetical protein
MGRYELDLEILLTLTVVVAEMMTANLVVLLPFLILRQSCLIAPVESILYLLNLFDTFSQLFVMIEENRYNDRMEWYQLNRIGASRNVELVQRQPPKTCSEQYRILLD